MTAVETDALEEGRAARAGTHLFLLVCVIATASLAAWSTYGTLDVVSVATGEVIPSSQVKAVQHLEGGIVREILVREGDRVKKDQPVVVLEPTASGANVDELLVRITSLRVDVSRFEAEASGAPAPVFAPDLVSGHPNLVAEARTLFATRAQRYQSDVAAQKEAVVQREEEAREIRARLRNDRERIKLLDEQVKISEELLKDDLTNRYNHLNLLREKSQLDSRIEEGVATLRRAEAALKEAQVRLARLSHAFREEAQKELDGRRRELDEATQRLRKLEDSLQRTIVRSPVDGVVKALYVVTEGGVVKPGGNIVDIVPADDRLIVEAALRTHDIGYVRTGQQAVVKLASSDAIRFGNLDGTVIHISADTFVSDDGRPYYKVRIATEGDAFRRGQLAYRLYPGMQVIASIKTGYRTVLEYLLDPFLGGVEEAMRER